MLQKTTNRIQATGACQIAVGGASGPTQSLVGAVERMGRRVRSLCNHQPPLHDEIDRLDSRILSEPARTIGDIAVQSAHALYLADLIASEAAFHDPSLVRLARLLRHSQASIVLAAAHQAGILIDAIGWPDLLAVCLREFPNYL